MNRTLLLAVTCVLVALAGACRPHDRRSRDFPTTRPAPEPMSLRDAMRLIDDRDAWTDHPVLNIPRHPAEKYLAGMIIVLDPGHGGEDGGDNSKEPPGYKAGPTGVKEAHMNLRVAQLLRRLLADAGATVIMTRQGDDTIGLRERAEVANNAKRPDGARGADLFISVHHNAVGKPETNYTSVWYHGSVDNNEVELDVAKYIGHALGREMRTDVARTSPVLSSQLMYAGGFGVLRTCHVPAILLECSFYTNPAEEQRLRDAGYNLREAYAVYVGLCEYAYGGRPTQSAPTATLADSRLTIATTLSEGLPPWWGADRSRIVRSTINVLVDGERIPFEYDEKTRGLSMSIDVSDMRSRWIQNYRRQQYVRNRVKREEAATSPVGPDPMQLVLEIHHANMFKHHNWPQRYRVTVAPDGSGDTSVEAIPPVRDSMPLKRATTSTAPATGPRRE